MMSQTGTLMLVTFLMVSSLVLLVSMLVSGRSDRVESRIDDLMGKATHVAEQPDTVAQIARTTLPKMAAPLVPDNEEERTLLKARLIHAGLYSPQAMPVFLGVKMLLMVLPALIGLSIGVVGIVPMRHGVMGGALLGVLGMIGPSLWLDWRKGKRQTSLRRALPDALDVLVICLEGGLSLPGALRRVATELRSAHTLLAGELNIAQREIQLGQPTGEAMSHLGERSDLEEVRSLAAVITQADRFGASLVKSLRVHADTLRLKRQQRAEEMAQKAGTKILFPTLLFIFPAIFVVILGPAAIQIMDMMGKMK
ncbi:MAG TPA: type II secretion system F family protein [Isosphaeraceae bacterium]|nr:type II secretion system F family protein [Isosphaeraceae bacterium]